MNNKNLKITIGIPTCYGGQTLVKTARSIRDSKGAENAEFIIVADRTPLTKDVTDSLRKLNIKLYWNETEGSQLKKLDQIFKLAKNDIFIFTQDDVIFGKNTISHILNEFKKNTNLTMLGVRILPLPPQNVVESALSTMVHLVDRIGRSWNKGNNHLMASGRCMAFRSDFFKNFRIPHNIVNSDMFFYLENKRLKGKFKSSKQSIAYIRCPQNMKEQLGASSRYQYSYEELKNYFDFDIKNEYKIPFLSTLIGLSKEFITHPISVILYLLIYIYTRANKQSTKQVSKTSWDTEKSTKK